EEVAYERSGPSGSLPPFSRAASARRRLWRDVPRSNNPRCGSARLRGKQPGTGGERHRLQGLPRSAPRLRAGPFAGRVQNRARLLHEALQKEIAGAKGTSVMTTATEPARGSIAEVTGYFLRLGLLGFGGPVALVGQMERELVAERGWLSKEEMRESIAICQSLPGPLAIQVGIYISYLRAGFWGAWAGGWAFIFPNFVIVAALGALYVYLGDLKPVTAVFYGVGPALIAPIMHFFSRPVKLGMEDWIQWAIAGVCFVVTIVLQAEVALLFIGSGIVGILYYGNIFRRSSASTLQSIAAAPVLAQLAPVASSSTLAKLLLFFLKAG